MLNRLVLSFSWLYSYLTGMAWARTRQSPTFSVTPLAPLTTISGGQRGSESWATMRSPSSFSHYGNPEKAWQGGLKSWGEVWWRRRHPKTKTPSLLVRCVTVASGCFLRDWPFLIVPHPNWGCLRVLEYKFLPFMSVLNPVLEFSQWKCN